MAQTMQRKYSEREKDHLKLCKCLLYFICVYKTLFHIVKSVGLKNVCLMFVRHVKFQMLTHLKDNSMFFLVLCIPKLKIYLTISLTSDIWSELITVTNYLGVTTRYMINDQLVSRCIATIALDQRHTGNLKEICTEIHICQEKISATDNAPI